MDRRLGRGWKMREQRKTDLSLGSKIFGDARRMISLAQFEAQRRSLGKVTKSNI